MVSELDRIEVVGVHTCAGSTSSQERSGPPGAGWVGCRVDLLVKIVELDN